MTAPDDGRPVYLNFGAPPRPRVAVGRVPDGVRPSTWSGFQRQRRADREPARRRARGRSSRWSTSTASSPRAASGPARSTTTPTPPCPQAVNDQAAYRRKNCRPTIPARRAPCTLRTGSGVDLNRNYGYYWGGPGSSSDATTQATAAPAPSPSPSPRRSTSSARASTPPSSSPTTPSPTTASGCASPGFDDVDQRRSARRGRDEGARRRDGAPRPAGLRARATRPSATSPAPPRTGTTSRRAPTATRPRPAGRTSTATYADMVVDRVPGRRAAPRARRPRGVPARRRGAPPAADHSVIEGPAPPGATLRCGSSSTPRPAPPGTRRSPRPWRRRSRAARPAPTSGTSTPPAAPRSSRRPGREPPIETWTMTCKRPGQRPSSPSRSRSLAASR